MKAWAIRLLLLPLTLALLAGAADAQQSSKEKKLYRWVDKNGQVHYGDSVPAEYAEQDREVLNRQGVSVGREEGTITPEEAAAKAAADKAARDEQKRKLRDRVLLQTTSRCRSSRSCATTASSWWTPSSRSRSSR